jgi:hypothetical protein
LLHSPQLAPGGAGLGPGQQLGPGLGSGDELLGMAPPPGMSPPPGMGHPGAGLGGKRGRGGDEYDSDEDANQGRGGPATNVFRQRQKLRLG